MTSNWPTWLHMTFLWEVNDLTWLSFLLSVTKRKPHSMSRLISIFQHSRMSNPAHQNLSLHSPAPFQTRHSTKLGNQFCITGNTYPSQASLQMLPTNLTQMSCNDSTWKWKTLFFSVSNAMWWEWFQILLTVHFFFSELLCYKILTIFSSAPSRTPRTGKGLIDYKCKAPASPTTPTPVQGPPKKHCHLESKGSHSTVCYGR